VRLAILILLLCSTALAQWKVGHNFRSTSGYVTDGADEVYVLNEAGPITRSTSNGNSTTFNWSNWDWVTMLNSNDTVDRRLAGYVQKNNNGYPVTMTITLPSTGQYIVRLAVGGYLYGTSNAYVQIRDNGNALITVDKGSQDAATYWDAAGTIRTAAAWPADNTSQTVTFTTTTCQMVIGTWTNSGGVTRISHLYLEKVAATARRKVVISQ
jgi:hypothetical protein